MGNGEAVTFMQTDPYVEKYLSESTPEMIFSLSPKAAEMNQTR